jgi:hypothetical protein
VWQAHRDRWFPQGLEIVAVALDVDAEEAKPFIEQANTSYPCLIDQAHVCDELFGFVNVPNAVWIDEQGMLVRPAEPAHPGRNPFTESFRSIDLSTLPPDVAEMLREARKIRSDPEQYVAMIDDWVAHGSESRFALAPDEVVRRSAHRGDDEARAAAEFELGQWLHRAGDHAAAIPHWRSAHRLQHDNWTYRRQAWNFEDPMRQGHTDAYDSSWYEDVKELGAENYYPEVIP